MRRHLFAVALLAAACSQGPSKKGPFVAQGNGVTITAEEFKARLDEQSPYIRARYTTLERKKEFLDNLIRFEVLAREAYRQELDKSEEVQNTLRKVMVQKLVTKAYSDQDAAGKVPEADQKEFYEKHRDEYVKPLRIRVHRILVRAPAAGPERAAKQATAKKLLAQIRTEEKKNALAFVTLARVKSEDEATKALGGDLNFRSRDDLEKVLGKPAADAAFALKDTETSSLLESPQGFEILKVAGRQEATERTFDQVKAQIAQKLYRERKTKEFDEFVKKLREEAAVKVDDAELEKVQVSAAPPPGMPGQPGMPPGMQQMPMGPARPPPPPPPAPAAK